MGGIPSWRSSSNNSVIVDDIDALLRNDEFWQGYRGNGEPYGLIHLAAMKRMGRTDETQYPDPLVEGCNPVSPHTHPHTYTYTYFVLIVFGADVGGE